MIDYFNFDILITPYIIGIIYSLGAIVVPFIILYYFKKYKFQINNTKIKLYIFIAFVMMEIFWRIFCEFFMVYFKIFLALNGAN
jgi:hypothetical protein